MKVINVDERIKKAIVNSTMEFFKVPKELFTRHKELEKDIVTAGNYIQEQIVAVPYMAKFEKLTFKDFR